MPPKLITKVVSASAGDKVTQFIGGRPRWENVYNAFPKTMSDQSLLVAVGYRPYWDKFGAAAMSAIRISLALINAGMKDLFDLDGKDPNKGRRLFTNVRELTEWLSSRGVWGKADKGIIKGCNGVYVILSSNAKNDRAMLWDAALQEVVGENNYFDDDGDVYFWELLGEGFANKCGIDHKKTEGCPRNEWDDLGDKKTTSIYTMLGYCHDFEIRERIDMASERLSRRCTKGLEIGRLLKGLWDRYEMDLKIYDIDAEETEFSYKEDDVKVDHISTINGNKNALKPLSDILSGRYEPGVHINFKDNRYWYGNKNGYAPYFTIIHELFHNIDYLTTHKLPEIVRRDYRNLRNKFIKSIKDEVCKLVKIDEKAIENNLLLGSKYVRIIDVDPINKIYKSKNVGLIDIVAGRLSGILSGALDGRCVLYTPLSDITIYAHKHNYWYKPDYITLKLLVRLGFYNEPRLLDIYKGYKLLIYRKNDLRQAVISSTFLGFANNIYNYKLGFEAFANMAAAAITDATAFEEIHSTLPDTYNKFVDILKFLKSKAI